MKTALLLIAHGSRHEEANADLRHVMAELSGRVDYEVVAACYLELAEPDIDEGARWCMDQGSTRLVLVPYFLSAGVHVLRDLEAARERLARRYADVEVILAEPLGRHPLLVEVVAQRARDAIIQAARP